MTPAQELLNPSNFQLSNFKTNKMAIAENGPLGPVKGKVGNVIFSSWLGTPYVRVNPGTRKKGNQKEKNTRKGFGEISWSFINPIKDFLQLSYREVARGNRGMFAARSYLLKHAVERDEMNNTIIVPSQMLMSRGSLELPTNIAVQVASAGELVISWDASNGAKPNKNDDQLMLVVYNIEARSAITSIGTAFRHEGNASISLQGLPPGQAHVYLSFLSFDRTRASDSVYLGEVENNEQ